MKLYKAAVLIIAMNFLSGSMHAAAAGDERKKIKVFLKFNGEQTRFGFSVSRVERLKSSDITKAINQKLQDSKHSALKAAIKSQYPEKTMRVMRVYEQALSDGGVLSAEPVRLNQIITRLEHPLLVIIEPAIMTKVKMQYGDKYVAKVDIRVSAHATVRELADEVVDTIDASRHQQMVNLREELHNSYSIGIYNKPIADQQSVSLGLQTTLSSLEHLALIAKIAKIKKNNE